MEHPLRPGAVSGQEAAPGAWPMIGESTMSKKLMVIDGNSIVNRSFYGIRPLTTRDGLYTNCLLYTSDAADD